MCPRTTRACGNVPPKNSNILEVGSAVTSAAIPIGMTTKSITKPLIFGRPKKITVTKSEEDAPPARFKNPCFMTFGVRIFDFIDYCHFT